MTKIICWSHDIQTLGFLENEKSLKNVDLCLKLTINEAIEAALDSDNAAVFLAFKDANDQIKFESYIEKLILKISDAKNISVITMSASKSTTLFESKSKNKYVVHSMSLNSRKSIIDFIINRSLQSLKTKESKVDQLKESNVRVVELNGKKYNLPKIKKNNQFSDFLNISVDRREELVFLVCQLLQNKNQLEFRNEYIKFVKLTWKMNLTYCDQSEGFNKIEKNKFIILAEELAKEVERELPQNSMIGAFTSENKNFAAIVWPDEGSEDNIEDKKLALNVAWLLEGIMGNSEGIKFINNEKDEKYA